MLLILWRGRWVFLACWVLVATGCSVGPRAVRNGRATYTEAIGRSDDQQLLMGLVRKRYGETFTMLRVASITSNMRFSARAGFDLGFGHKADYAGNLVPFSGGFAYEENPTISYTPRQGEEYLRQLHSPIPLELVVLMLRTSRAPGRALSLLVSEVNGIPNPEFLPEGAEAPDARFVRFVELFTALSETGQLDFGQASDGSSFWLILRNRGRSHEDEARELAELMGVSPPDEEPNERYIPLRLSFLGAVRGEVSIVTRSIADIAEILAASVDVPEEDVRSGAARRFPAAGLAGERIAIRRSKERPLKASAAALCRGHWYYIDETDQETKAAFQLLRTMWLVRVADAPDSVQSAPVLTVPVSR